MKNRQGVLPFLISLFLIGGTYEQALRILRYLLRGPFRGLDTFTRIPSEQYLVLVFFLIVLLHPGKLLPALRHRGPHRVPLRSPGHRSEPMPVPIWTRRRRKPSTVLI